MSNALGTVRPTVYECEGCALTFDDDRDNCPACGFDVIEAR